MSSETLKQTLLAMAGDKNTITVNRAFVEFTGSLEAGMMLGQLLYWTPRTQRPDGFVFKSDQDWMNELCLSRYAVRKAREALEGLGILSTKVEMARGAPTTHYQLDLSVLVELWTQWTSTNVRLSEIRQSIVRNQTIDCSISDNRLSEIEQSITETTTETTREYEREHTRLSAVDSNDYLADLGSFLKQPTPTTEIVDHVAGLIGIDPPTWNFEKNWGKPAEQIWQEAQDAGLDLDGTKRMLTDVADASEGWLRQRATSPAGFYNSVHATLQRGKGNGQIIVVR